MAAAKVLDSWAVLCYLEQEPGFEKMIDLFEKAVSSFKPLLMCIVNSGQAYYQITRSAWRSKGPGDRAAH